MDTFRASQLISDNILEYYHGFVSTEGTLYLEMIMRVTF